MGTGRTWGASNATACPQEGTGGDPGWHWDDSKGT